MSQQAELFTEVPAGQDIARGRVFELLQQGGVGVFTGDELHKLTKPCVYILIRRGKVAYVGMSKRGGSRFLNPSHHVLRGTFDRGDILYNVPCHSVNDALELEGLLIDRLQPTLNIRRRLDNLSRTLGSDRSASQALLLARSVRP